MKPDVEKPKYNCKSRNTIAKAEIHLENAEIHLQIVQFDKYLNGEIGSLELHDKKNDKLYDNDF
jgi:hypothetical protein